jgi:penicillin-binding protein 2
MITITNEPKRYEGVENRVQIMALVLAVVFVVPCFRLWDLQVVRQQDFQHTADAQRISDQPLESDRGVIYGHNDVILADNRASVNIVFTPGECPDVRREEVSLRLADLLGLERSAVLVKVEKAKKAPFTQITIKSDVTKAELYRVEENGLDLPGVAPVVRPQRRYLYRETGGQLLGYLGEISPRKLENPFWRDRGYKQGDVIGLGGLEAQYEEQLQGEDGFLLVTRYASGRPQLRTDRGGMPILAARDSAGNVSTIEGEGRQPRAGEPLHLTLDIALQAKCESLLSDRGDVGAIVVLNAETGAVLALASVPSYDPSVFVSHDPTGQRARLLKAGDPKPMLHRAFREQFPPGSVFKVMLAAAALEEGVITPESSHYCGGGFKINGKGRTWHCWKRAGHGRVAVKEALAYSCDVFFYNVGLDLGVDKIQEWSYRMGMGVSTGIDLPNEITGLIPGKVWKAKVFSDKPVWDQKWFKGDTVNLSIGQGSAATTPLQNAVMMAAIVNGGYRVVPHLSRDLNVTRSDRFLSDATVARIWEGMQMCVDKAPPDYPTGTGWRAGVEGVTILGKTGSAQIMNLSHHEKYETEEDIPYEFRDHAWFVAGVIDRDPKIALCILVEHGHHGSTSASVLAKPLIEYFYRDEMPADVQIARGENPSQ